MVNSTIVTSLPIMCLHTPSSQSVTPPLVQIQVIANDTPLMLAAVGPTHFHFEHRQQFLGFSLSPRTSSFTFLAAGRAFEF